MWVCVFGSNFNCFGTKRNDGERVNCGQVKPEREEEGVYIGAVGARFERADQMESLHMIITDNCTEANGYGKNGDDVSIVFG